MKLLPATGTAVRETDVASVAIAALAPQWAEHWPEVPSLSGRVDIVGRDADGGLHAVECKTQPSLALAAQAVARMQERAFASVLCVVGLRETARHNTKDGGSDLMTLGIELGFGVATVRGKNFKLVLAPRPLLVEAEPKAIVSRALNDIHREVAGAAGGQSSAYWTEWKQGIYEIEQAVAKKPGINVYELRFALKITGVLYWQNHNAQIRTMAEQSKKIRAEFAGREYRYFPALSEGRSAQQ